MDGLPATMTDGNPIRWFNNFYIKKNGQHINERFLVTIPNLGKILASGHLSMANGNPYYYTGEIKNNTFELTDGDPAVGRSLRNQEINPLAFASCCIVRRHGTFSTNMRRASSERSFETCASKSWVAYCKTTWERGSFVLSKTLITERKTRNGSSMPSRVLFSSIYLASCSASLCADTRSPDLKKVSHNPERASIAKMGALICVRISMLFKKACTAAS